MGNIYVTWKQLDSFKSHYLDLLGGTRVLFSLGLIIPHHSGKAVLSSLPSVLWIMRFPDSLVVPGSVPSLLWELGTAWRGPLLAVGSDLTCVHWLTVLHTQRDSVHCPPPLPYASPPSPVLVMWALDTLVSPDFQDSAWVPLLYISAWNLSQDPELGPSP